MATTAVTEFGTVFQFTLNTAKLSKVSENTPEVVLSGLNWKIRFSKKSSDGDQKTETLSVHLVSESKQKDMNWSCEAQAAFKLLRKDDQVDKSVVKYLNKTTFNSDNSCHGVDDFINWNDLQKNYSYDNKVTFEIELSTSPLKRKRNASEAINRCSVKFQMHIKDVSKLTTTSVRSPEVVLQGVRWHVRCSKYKDRLIVYLYSNRNDMEVNWTYKVDASFTLLSMKKESMHLKKKYSKNWDSEIKGWGFANFLVWNEFVSDDEMYVSQDSANIFVEVKVQEPVPKWKIMCHTLSKAEQTIECAICFENFPSGNIFSIKCGHLFCKPCFTNAMANRKECPTCKVATRSIQLHPIYFG